MKDHYGKVRKIVYIPNIDGFGARAYVRIGLFGKIENLASGPNAVENLAKRLESMGWEKVQDDD